MNSKKIQRALLSIYDKNGIEPIIERLIENKVELLSTGGTKSYIEKLGYKVTAVEDITDYPAILGGRVKTLHPKIFGGILNRRDKETDAEEIEKYDIKPIDLVIVDLYPFEETVKNSSDESEIIEKIDIGGISLIRAAAKNFKDVVCLPSKDYYNQFLKLYSEGKGSFTLEQRKQFAAKTFHVSNQYDNAIFKYLNNETEKSLRYGENPHQKASFVGNFDEIFEKLNGKEISYNNLLDIDAALDLMKEFENENPTFAILKHNNACGIATRGSVLEAYENALSADPISAFGGVLISNKPIDNETSTKINKLFCEVIIAPYFEKEALDLLKTKKNRILLKLHQYPEKSKNHRSNLNGYLAQESDYQTDSQENLSLISTRKPNVAQVEDLLFAAKVVKHTKSNAIVLVKDKKLLASGTGQTSRIDALKQAIEKAKKFNFNLTDASMASDAFFPFPDCVEEAHKEQINFVIHPGGSKNDQLSIDYCNENNMGMAITGYRHFKH